MEPPPEGSSRNICRLDWCVLLAILLLSTGLRFQHLGRLSLWYDEVVTVRLARTPSPMALVRLLDQIDATRAPLHPLLLQGWLKVCGTSDFASRALSALCGILTVLLVFSIGRRASDTLTGLWAAWLAAWSPVLVQYSQETRMYAWLVLLTCLAWSLLLSLPTHSSRASRVAYTLVLVAIIYSHPLGLIMVATLCLASLLLRTALRLSWPAWFSIYGATAVMVGPWLPRYLGHSPEYLIGRLPLRFLFGLPIGFIGGNSLTLLPIVAVIAFGLLRISRDKTGKHTFRADISVGSTCLIFWFFVPPLVLYAYSWIKHPIFGPSRYTIFVGPAYLLLVARGLRKLPRSISLPVAGAGVVLSISLLTTLVYNPELKTDWRAIAAYLDHVARGEPVVLCGIPSVSHPSFVAARYYFGDGRPLFPMPARPEDPATDAWHVIVAEPRQTEGQAMVTSRCAEPSGRVISLPAAKLISPGQRP